VDFRDRLLETLRSARPVLEVPGVLVVGSEVPNLLQPGAASTLVVSQDVDIAVPITSHSEVKRRLPELHDLHPSVEEPSVWVPKRPELLEVNFLGRDPSLQDGSETYVLEDPELPLLVFGALGLVEPGTSLEIEGLTVPLPRIAGLLLEKLVTDRSGEKGDRDLLVALGLLLLASPGDLTELEHRYRTLSPEARHTVSSNLSVLSLLPERSGMPDPTNERQRIAAILRRLEEVSK
jgi:hypothetical protein